MQFLLKNVLKKELNMTRIYCTPVEEMTIAALRSEYRQIDVTFINVRKVLTRGIDPADPKILFRPKKYKFGIGHLRFFYDKLAYVVARQIDIKAELQKRKKQVRALDHGLDLFNLPRHLLNDWTPTPEAIKLSKKANDLYEKKAQDRKSLLKVKKAEAIKELVLDRDERIRGTKIER
jgi:hypothetical protein